MCWQLTSLHHLHFVQSLRGRPYLPDTRVAHDWYATIDDDPLGVLVNLGKCWHYDIF
jgi:hypothetical protein